MMDRPQDSTSAEKIATPADSSATAAMPDPAPHAAPPSATTRPRLTQTALEDEGRFIAGTIIAGRYRIVGLLGKGGMGEVYRATDLALGQSVALKFLPHAAAENPQLLERFHGEVRVARQVSHPNVCRVFDIGETDGMPYISMEYVDGEDLSSLLQRIGRLPADKALDTSRRICAGLAAAHAKGVIHRDLKPQNIMMNRRGEVLIMDFGLAAVADQLAGPEARNGTPAYMSPEQLKGTEVTSRSDIYALGLVLYEIFTGRRPYVANTARQLIALQEAAQLASVSSIAADVDPAVEQVIRRCLDPDPSKRPDSPLAVSAALPGGDPLAAALAAGETPSPELVAASGQTEGIPLKYALLCLVTVFVCLFIQPFLKQKKSALLNSPSEFTPEVLSQKARDISASLGYPARPVDQNLYLSHRGALLTWFNQKPEPRDWSKWLAAEPTLLASYRESPSLMISPPRSYVSLSTPPLTDPGMVALQLDGAGQLRSFTAVPYPEALATPINPEAVFEAAHLRFADFTETQPTLTPEVASDQIRAWKGHHPLLPNTEVTIDIAQWKGRVTQVRFIWPWNRNGAPPTRNPFMAQLRGFLDPLLESIALICGCLLAHRNWKLQRGDRRGAFLIGAFAVTVRLFYWFCAAHFVPSGVMLDFFGEALAAALKLGLFLTVIYLALEPELRARWPHSIITWSRLLAGNWRDSQVAAHVLIGAAVAAAMWTAVLFRASLEVAQNGLESSDGLYLLEGARKWLGSTVIRLDSSMEQGLLIFFAICGLRILLRNQWLVSLVGAALFTILEGDLSNATNLPVEFATYMILFTILIWLLLRYGLVVSISAVFFVNTMSGTTLGTDLTAWYVPVALASVLTVAIPVVFAFRQSLGSQGLLRGSAS